MVLSSFLMSTVCFSQSKNILKKYPKEIQKIVLTEDGVFRNFSFDDKKSTIKQKESLKLHNETDSSLIYTIYLDADNSADILYYFDSTGAAKGFAIVFILADENAEKNLKSSFINFFSEKYGAYKVVNQEDELWDSKKGYLIEMRDTSDEAGMEIEIAYYRP